MAQIPELLIIKDRKRIGEETAPAQTTVLEKFSLLLIDYNAVIERIKEE